MNNEAVEADKCLGIVDLSFVTADDTDSVLVATKHPSGGRLELWELKEFQQNIHKMFVNSDSLSSTFSLPAWHYIEKFSVSGLTSQIVSVATPLTCFQTGRAAACYVTIAYSDGSIQCLIRDNLQQIGSVDLPKSGLHRSDLSKSDLPHSDLPNSDLPSSDLPNSDLPNVMYKTNSSNGMSKTDTLKNMPKIDSESVALEAKQKT